MLAFYPLDSAELQILLTKVPDPRNLWVWKVGLKDWIRAGDIQELAAFIHKPPPFPQGNRLRSKPWAAEGVWRSAAAIAVSLAVVWVASDYLVVVPLAALPLALALDWATRRRRQLVTRAR